MGCLFRQRVSEWATPLHCAREAAFGLRDLVERRGFHAHLPIEIRFTAGDDIWLSPAYQRDLVAFHFTFRQDVPGVLRILYGMEQQLAPLSPLPHWGKLFAMSPAKIAAGYPRLADFRALAAKHDPAGKFRNRFVDKYVFGG